MRLHDRVRDERSRDLSSAEPATVQAFDGLTSSVHGFKEDVDLALYNGEQMVSANEDATYLSFLLDLDRLHRTILSGTFTLNIISKVLIPVSFGFPI